MTVEEFKKNQYGLPIKSGVYCFYKHNELLYVGKAINIKKRVSSYFQRSKNTSSRIELMIKKTSHIDFTIVNNESDALILENNLIKAHRPKYNILLKDDKTYPFICIKNERFPRITITRKINKDGAKYYGPYTSVKLIKSIIKFITNTYQIRSCKYDLSEKNILTRKYKICLDYHIGKCKGPCEGLQSEKSYDLQMNEVTKILKGNTKDLLVDLESEMNKASGTMEFEKAQEYKNRIYQVEKFYSKSIIVNPRLNNIAVFNIEKKTFGTYVNFIKLINGSITLCLNFNVQNNLNENEKKCLEKSIIQILEKYSPKCKVVLTPFKVNIKNDEIQFLVPIKGDKKKLLDLSLLNLKTYTKSIEQKRIEINTPYVIEQLKKDLNLDKAPKNIECFDISHLQGEHVVASLVVFKNGVPAKSKYRHFNIKHGQGNNDFLSMEEVVLRHYKKYLNTNTPLPELIIIDGGKGQLNASLKSLQRLEIENKVETIGLAKRLESVFFYKKDKPIMINRKSTSLKLLQRVRNEAHRFAIDFHRLKRSKALTDSELFYIDGVGKSSVEKLFNKLKSVKKIKSATLKELTLILGPDKGKKVYMYFNKL